jgi:HTH-type transcriptional regulator/antitoxin HigA
MSSTITAYQALLQEYTPRPIRTAAAYRKALRQVDGLMRRRKLSRAENELLEVLATLVEQYESKEYPTPANTPHGMLAHLIEARGATQAEVARATGIPRSTISAVLAGRRQISKANVVKLAGYFGVSAAVFLGPAKSG